LAFVEVGVGVAYVNVMWLYSGARR